MAQARHRLEAPQARRLVEEFHPLVFERAIIGAPGVPLVHHLVAHYRFRAEQAQEAELREPAEEQADVIAGIGQPIERE